MELLQKGFFRRAASQWGSGMEKKPAIRENEEFLPDFCSGWMVLNVVVIAEMLAIVITLITRRIFRTPFEDLLYISLFVQWIALTSVAALCYARKYLNKLPPVRALWMAFLLLLCITWLVSEGALWLLWLTEKISSAHPEWYSYFHIQNLSVSAVVSALALRYFLAKHQLRQRTLSEAQAKMQASRSRIRSHFVFSSLNIIASLIRTDSAKAEEVIEDMADLFRMMLSQDENLVPVKNEIEVTKKYLALESLRLDNRIRVDWDIGKFPRKAVMPVLTLQPLLENAVRHGIEPLPAGGEITIRLWEAHDKIHITVTNPIARTKGKKIRDSNTMGLENIRQRFHHHYGDAASLETTEETDQFIIRVALPTRGNES